MFYSSTPPVSCTMFLMYIRKYFLRGVLKGKLYDNKMGDEEEFKSNKADDEIGGI